MKSDISVALKSFLGRGELNMAADRKRGRPKGTGINDHELLLQIAQIMVANPTKKRTTAIKDVGITNASVVRRLRDKYQAEETQLLAEVHAANAAAAAPIATQATAPAKAGRKSAANGHAAAPAAVKAEPSAPAATKKGKASQQLKTAVVAEAPAAVQVHVEAIAAAPAVATAQAEAPQAAVVQATAQATPAAAPQAPAQPAAAAATAQAKAPNPAQAAKPAVDPLAALFEGLNIETLVTQFIGHALGLSAAEIKNSPIPALIRQQAQLADLVLPLLASQFLGQKQTSKAA
jgi:outer membrane biosynthesis protein TonB